MSTATILIADNDNDNRTLLQDDLKLDGYDILSVKDGERALALLHKQHIDILIADEKLSKVDGIGLLTKIKSEQPELPVIIIAGTATVGTAVQAIKLGAEEYLTKPINVGELKELIRKLLLKKNTYTERVTGTQHHEASSVYANIIGASEQIQKVFKLIDKIADVDSTIIIYGESGTGKELIARAVHTRSYRSKQPLIPVNCGAIPEELLESELFGHEKGSFTSAYKMRVGRFEMANGGTIFLDEIGDMSPNLQVKILRVLQEHEFDRVGGVQPIKADIRVIAATHRDLEKAVAEGKFREDLYYRLNVIPIHIPPLRERKSDIPRLVSHFIEKFNKEKDKAITGIAENALDCFMKNDWPGNVRELQNIMERLVILKGSGLIEVDDLPDKLLHTAKTVETGPVCFPSDGTTFNTMVTNFEKQLILDALHKSNGVKNKAAKMLNMNRTTLVEKMKKLEIKYKS